MSSKNIFKNPMLCGTMELLKAEDTQENRKLFVDELSKAHLLAPVVISPVPQPDAQGRIKLTPESKVEFPMLPTKDGVPYFMAFTDYDELKKFDPSEKLQTMVFGLKDYAELLFRKNKEGQTSPAAGFVINPLSNNVVVSKQMVAKYFTAEMIKKGVVPAPKPAAEPEAADAGEGTSEE